MGYSLGSDVAKVQARTLLVFADADSIRPEPTSPDGEVVEPSCCLSAIRIFANRQLLTIGGLRA
jgi:hypothetical protein